MKKATKKEIEEIKKIFVEKYSDAVTELNYENLYQLLIAVMLSAQCTDKRVNIITPALFQKYPDVKTLANANIDDIKELIKTCSFFNNKAKNLIKMAQSVVQNFNGEIPLNEKDLISLAGVGQKTAHVVMIEYKQANLMAVDTHVFRVAHRLGLSDEKTAIKTEEELSKKFKTDLHILHQAMVLFGRYICKAVKPECQEKCFLKEYCKTKKVLKFKKFYANLEYFFKMAQFFKKWHKNSTFLVYNFSQEEGLYTYPQSIIRYLFRLLSFI